MLIEREESSIRLVFGLFALAWGWFAGVVAVPEIVQEVLVAVFDVLNLSGCVLRSVHVKLASGRFLFVNTASFITHLDDLINSALSISSRQII